jgi:hypothetical protein
VSSRREQILAAVVALLVEAGDTPAAGRERVNPHDSASLPARDVSIAPLANQPQEITTPARGRQGDPATKVYVRTLRIAVEHYAAGSSSQVLDPLLCATTEQVGADMTLGGLAHWIEEESTTWEIAPRDQDYRKATIVYAVQYQTRRNSQELA